MRRSTACGALCRSTGDAITYGSKISTCLMTFRIRANLVVVPAGHFDALDRGVAVGGARNRREIEQPVVARSVGCRYVPELTSISRFCPVRWHGRNGAAGEPDEGSDRGRSRPADRPGCGRHDGQRGRRRSGRRCCVYGGGGSTTEAIVRTRPDGSSRSSKGPNDGRHSCTTPLDDYDGEGGARAVTDFVCFGKAEAWRVTSSRGTLLRHPPGAGGGLAYERRVVLVEPAV